MSSPIRVLLTSLSLLIGFIAFWQLAPTHVNFGLFRTHPSAGIIANGIWGFLMTIAGVFLGSAYRTLSLMKLKEGRKTVGRPRVIIKRLIGSIDLWLGIVAAPLVYALILQSATGLSAAGLTVVGLQNGFCCLVIADSLVPTLKESTQADP